MHKYLIILQTTIKPVIVSNNLEEFFYKTKIIDFLIDIFFYFCTYFVKHSLLKKCIYKCKCISMYIKEYIYIKIIRLTMI